ncbi:MAG: hypothetical protein M3O80_05285 [Chloroflexota bacterium]|nr:hypothetical protein [Chloroflexota bacterium]
MRSRLPLAAIIFAVLLASCGGTPSVIVVAAGKKIPMALASTTVRTGCSSEHGDAFPRDVPLTIVNSRAPVLHIEAGQGATGIRGWIYDVDAPTTSGGPLEEFTLSGRSGDHEAKSIVTAHTYTVVVNVTWSALVTGGEVTHVFRLRVDSP